ncbi:hypothetical protein QJS10_CPB21g00539 [Acorus calamus]|uniref:Uncharacterized protein n=1 Tax=Acorus calamus TaxID=4465 RepID=A0AAV9C6I8_ACOCL|nr:hypothetical protein QJS10_CPB21g00539 [Acorus calamus]
MVGGPSAVSSNSPLLRRSGSKPVLSELINEMKSASLPLTGAAIMPSPALLWRFKVLLFILWGFICCKVGWDSVMRMSADLRDLFIYEAFLYYNPLLLMSLTVWLWGVNLWVFSQSQLAIPKFLILIILISRTEKYGR